MAHLTMFPGNHEIVEIEEELNPDEPYRNNNFMKAELKREQKDQRSIASNSSHVSSLDEDLNQLFEMFNRRTSSQSRSNKGVSSRKNDSKKPIKSGGSHSPGNGISSRVNLKQALRGLCLSQASEMAVMKRSAKPGRSSEAGRIMTLYRNVVVEDSTSDNSRVDDRGGMGMLEISLVPEEPTFQSFQNSPESLPASDLWPSNRSSLAEKGGVQVSMKSPRVLSVPYPHVDDSIPENEFAGQTSLAEVSKKEKRVSLNSSHSSHEETPLEMLPASLRVGNQMPKENSPCYSDLVNRDRDTEQVSIKSPRVLDSKKTGSQTSRPEKSVSVSVPYPLDDSIPKNEFAGQTSLTEVSKKEKRVFPNSSDSSHEETPLEMFPTSHRAGNEMPKENSPRYSDLVNRDRDTEPNIDVMTKQKEKHVPLHTSSQNIYFEEKEGTKLDGQVKEEHPSSYSPRRSNLCDKVLDQKKNTSPTSQPKSTKVEPSVQNDSLKIIPSSKKPTRNTHHFVKPIIKTRNFVKRKSKKKIASDNTPINTHSEFHNDLYSSPHPIVCPRCQCVVTDAWKETHHESSTSHQDSPVSHQESPLSQQESPLSHHESPVSYQDSPTSPFVSLSADVSSGNVISDVSTLGPSSDSLIKFKAVVYEGAGDDSKLREKGESSKSLKVSPDKCSSSTSYSEESNVSRPSFCDRPHMSRDIRWEAIRRVRVQHGTIGLRHFNLLKKLGCGDIGTVYLAELISTSCLFAIKVMDNEFLARRKKIGRAQTEREILRMLDHPFLPTLYSQFTSDNLSCLVMEYCPGGDLHVLRQKQPGRCFTEQAARFYVAEVLLALEYLHMLGVIYRDLKPENILVREDGHIMLSDFDLSLRCAVSPTLVASSSISETSRKTPGGSSRCVEPLCIEPSCQVSCFTPRLSSKSKKLKKLKSDLAAELRPLLQLVAEPTAARSNSFVGTHEYLAPEIIKGEGHGSAVDWWTFGIFLYELLYGRTPFKGGGNEDTLANVVLQSLKFPDSPLVSLQARDLITALLVKEPENRLGTERGTAEIKQHPFFNGLNWALIRCAVPPELPEYQSYAVPKGPGHEKNNKYGEFSPESGSGSGPRENAEFEVF